MHRLIAVGCLTISLAYFITGNTVGFNIYNAALLIILGQYWVNRNNDTK